MVSYLPSPGLLHSEFLPHERKKKKKKKKKVPGTSVLSLSESRVTFLVLIFTVLGLHFCLDFSLVVASEGYSLVAEHGLLIAVIFLVVEHWFRHVSFK